MLYIGIDVAKSKHDCCIIDSDGAVYADNLRIPNNRAGFNRLLETILNALNGEPVKNAKAGLDALDKKIKPIVRDLIRLCLPSPGSATRLRPSFRQRLEILITSPILQSCRHLQGLIHQLINQANTSPHTPQWSNVALHTSDGLCFRLPAS